MSDRDRDEGDVVKGESDERASGQTRREFLGNSVIAAIGLSLGCGVDPAHPRGHDAASGDGGASDAGVAISDAAPLDDASMGHDADGTSDGGVPQVEDPESVVEATSSFPLGVASGDATSTSAIFWTSYLGTAPIELVVWEMDDETYARTVYVGSVIAGEAGYVHVDVPMLVPGGYHRFAFFEKDGDTRVSRSAIGSMRAALAENAMEPLRIGAVSCVSNERPIPTIGHAASRDDFDCFIYLGDTSYNDDSRSLGDFRSKWAQQIGRPEFRALRRKTSAIATWDDHEIDNDWNPETINAGVRSSATQTFFEYQPLRRDPRFPNRVWKRIRWGRTVEFFVLDCRSERLPSTRNTSEAQYVSPEQLEWLKESLISSECAFKLILNTVPITALPGSFSLWSPDRWEGYTTQREEILGFIDDSALTGVLWISGDLHFGSAQRVGGAGAGANQIEVLVGPGSQITNPLFPTLSNERFDFKTAHNNYAVLDLDPVHLRVRVSWHRGSGAVIDTREYELG